MDIEDFGGVRIDGVTLGMYSHDQKEGGFEIKFKNIEVIYKEEFDELSEKYLFPVMFKSFGKDGVDTGRRVLKYEKVNIGR